MLTYYLSYLKKYSLSSFWSSWASRWYSPNSSHFLNMFRTQNQGEARFSDIRWDLLFLRLLKSSIERIHLPKKYQFYSASNFYFCNLSFLNFGLIWTCSFFFQWKLYLCKFSTWNKKSDPIIISSCFTVTHNGNQL